MSKEDNIEFKGIVTDLLPESRCMVQLENGHKVLCYTAGKLKKFKIRIKSKDTGKIIDLNIKFNVVKDNII